MLLFLSIVFFIYFSGMYLSFQCVLFDIKKECNRSLRSSDYTTAAQLSIFSWLIVFLWIILTAVPLVNWQAILRRVAWFK